MSDFCEIVPDRPSTEKWILQGRVEERFSGGKWNSLQKASQFVPQNRRYQMRSCHMARLRLYQRRPMQINSIDGIFNIFRDLQTEKVQKPLKIRFFSKKIFFKKKNTIFFNLFFIFFVIFRFFSRER